MNTKLYLAAFFSVVFLLDPLVGLGIALGVGLGFVDGLIPRGDNVAL